jgi:hypothetical protein
MLRLMSTANGFECQIRNSAETIRIERVAERKHNLLPTLRDSTRNDKARDL